MGRRPFLASRLQGLGFTVFAEMSRLAAEHQAINLGQGFPDFDPDPRLLEAAITAMRSGHNQYAPGDGVPALRVAISLHQQRFWGLDWDPDVEVLVSAGATEAVTAALLALLEVGDEVVLFEPYYDSYPAATAMAGAAVKAVPLHPPGFTFDPEELDAAITPRTRVLVLNTPHNPSGKVFTRQELDLIAELCRERNLIAITDEVYEHLVYDGEHIALANLPGMRERTIQISSAGKTFSVTGWKVGWICATRRLIDAVRTTKQYMTFTNGTPFQHALAKGLHFEDDFFIDLAESHRTRRDRMAEGLAGVGLSTYPSQGSYFMLADVSSLGFDDDVEFCRKAPFEWGVAAVPCRNFYVNPRRRRTLVRFAFCKTQHLIDEAVRRLRNQPRPHPAGVRPPE